MTRKSYPVALLVTLIFGPLGVFYTSAWQAFVLLIAVFLLPALGLYPVTTVIVIWAISVAVNLSGVSVHNKAKDDQYALDERRHKELLEAAARGSANRL